MLPDYPKTKRYIQKRFQNLIQKEIRDNPLLSLIKYRDVHEGSTYSITSEDGYTQKGAYKNISAISAKFEISQEEMILKGPEALFSRVRQIAEEMINQSHHDFVKVMEEATERTGNIVDAKSKSFSPELILAALDKVSIDFDEFGNPILPALIVSPEQFEKIKKEIPEWESDPILTIKYNILRKLIIDKKRQEWIDRESSRQLVD